MGVGRAGCHMGGGQRSKKGIINSSAAGFVDPPARLEFASRSVKKIGGEKESVCGNSRDSASETSKADVCHPNFHETFVLYSALKSNVHNYSRKFSENPCALICQKKHIENMQMLSSVTLCCQVTMIVMI